MPASEMGFQEDCLKVALIYDCLPSAQNAASLLKRVTHHAGQEARLSLWKLDHLGLPQLRETITEDIQHANLVVLCCPQDLRLPENARILLEDWAARKSAKPRALAVIFIASRNPRVHPKDKTHILDFLELLDQDFAISIFMDTVIPSSHRNNLSVKLPASLQPSPHRRSHPMPHWGLNE